jgi:hypothetical protein
MATNIQASPTSGLIISPDQSGILTLQSGSNTATMPAATGTVMVSGNQPGFSASYSGAFSMSNNTNTKVPFSNLTGGFNLGGYDNVTNYRFTPTVAGYYQINASVNFPTFGSSYCAIFVYKNGSSTTLSGQASYGAYPTPCVSGIIYLNGTGDYIELYGYQNSGGTLSTCYAQYFNAMLIRNA